MRLTRGSFTIRTTIAFPFPSSPLFSPAAPRRFPDYHLLPRIRPSAVVYTSLFHLSCPHKQPATSSRTPYPLTRSCTLSLHPQPHIPHGCPLRRPPQGLQRRQRRPLILFPAQALPFLAPQAAQQRPDQRERRGAGYLESARVDGVREWLVRLPECIASLERVSHRRRA